MDTSTSRREARLVIALALLASLAAAVAANLWARRLDTRIDFTQHGVYSLGSETERALARLEAPVRITFFYDLRNQAHRDARALLDRYAEASQWVEARGFDPDLAPALAQHYGVRFAGETVFEGAGAPFVVPGAGEEVFTNGLLRAQRSAGRSVCFSAGHGESDPASLSSHDHFEDADDAGHDHHDHSGGRAHRVVERHGMGLAREALETLGYRVAKRVLATGADPLVGCDALVVASPIRPFTHREQSVLEAYADRGGALLLLLEPEGPHGLDAFLASFGILHTSGVVRDPTHHYWTDPNTPAVSEYPRHRITRGVGLSFFPGAAALVPAGPPPADVVVTPLVETSADAHRVGAAETGAHALMVYAVRTRERGTDAERRTRVVVAGDGDFATNSFFPVLGNRDLLLNAIATLTEVEHLVGIAPRGYASPRLELSAGQLRASFAISTLLLPGLALVFGLRSWWRRR